MVTVTLDGSIGVDTFDTTEVVSPLISSFIIKVSDGNDFVKTGATEDQLFGGKGHDWLDAGDGDDFIFAGNGNDTALGGRGNDTIFGGAGNDFIRGGHGNDVLDGGNGDDIIWGDKGRNTIDAGNGNDQVDTGVHTSTVDGGNGDDIITARMMKGGDHVLTGGAGADTFEFIQSSAREVSNITITDFELGVDDWTLEGQAGTQLIGNLLLGGPSDLSISEVDGDTVMTIAGSDTITLDGVDVTNFLNYYIGEIFAIG